MDQSQSKFFARDAAAESSSEEEEQHAAESDSGSEAPSAVQEVEQPSGPLKDDAMLDEAELAWETAETEKGEKKWKNRSRTLIVSSGGVSRDVRGLLDDLHSLLAHSKKDQKLERKRAGEYIDEICFLNSCNHCMYVEAHKKQYYFMWLLSSPAGPSAKFQLENINTMRELKLTGNALQGSRPLLSFDAGFGKSRWLRVMKELLTHSFGTPRNHPKAKPFYDHVFAFSFYAGRIYFRNYQFLNAQDQDFSADDSLEDLQLVEIGPRFTLNPIKIFEGSMHGKTLWENSEYLSPVQIRKQATMLKKQHQRAHSKF